MNVFSTIEGIRTSVLYPLMYLVPNSWRWQSWRLYFLTFGMKLTSSKSEVKIVNVFFKSSCICNEYMMNTSQNIPHECICHMYSFYVSHECSTVCIHSKMTLQNTKGVVFMNVFVSFFAIFWNGLTEGLSGSVLCAKSSYYLLCSRVGEQQQSFLPRA